MPRAFHDFQIKNASEYFNCSTFPLKVREKELISRLE